MLTPPDADSVDGTVAVLIADDDPWTREVCRYLLTDEGYQVLEACDGVETLDTLLLSSQRLVVLLDLLMPRLTGFDLLLRIADDQALIARHAFIVCSAKAHGPESVGPHFTALLERLRIRYIAKPYNIEDVLAAVAEAARRLTPPDDDNERTQPA